MKITKRRVRIGVEALFFDYYSGLPRDFRKTKEAWYQETLQSLKPGFDIVDGGLVDSVQSARESAQRLKSHNIEALLILPTMAVTSEVGLESARICNVPLVIWNTHECDQLPAHYGVEDLVRHSSNVGTLALCNALLRDDKRFLMTTGLPQRANVKAEVAMHLRAASLSGLLSTLQMGLIGEAFPGMVDANLSDDILRQNNLQPTQLVPMRILQNSFAEISENKVAEEVKRMKESYSCSQLTDTSLTKSARLALALEQLSNAYGLNGGAVNCHAKEWRMNPELGVLGCYAVSRLTTMGIPFACTGDLCTGLAMILAKRLGGTAFYCEVDLLDYRRGQVLLSNSGEMDFEYSRLQKEQLTAHSFYDTAAGTSVVVSGTLQEGEATLLALTPLPSSRLRLIAALGRVQSRKAKRLPISNCVFRFERQPIERAFDEWCLGGANHHAVLIKGNLTHALKSVAYLRNWEFQEI